MNPKYAQRAQRVYFEQLKRNIPIDAVLSRYGIELKRSGKNLKGPCPIHQGSSASFVVDENRNVWHCFSPKCQGRGGGILELVSELEHIDIREAALALADYFVIKPSSDVQHREPRSKAMSEGSKPTHKVYSSQKRGEGEKDWLTPIGSAWVFNTKDGREGLSIQLSAMPLGDRMVIFARDEEYEQRKEAEKQATPNAKFAGKKK